MVKYAEAYLNSPQGVDEKPFEIKNALVFAKAEQKGKQFSILLTEKSNSISKALLKSLKEEDCRVVVVRTAMESLERLVSGDSFDLAVFSQHQAGLLGFTMAAILKLETGLESKTKSVLLSSNDIEFKYKDLKADFVLKKDETLIPRLLKITQGLKALKSASAND
jgi:hypothetical protein